MYSLFFRRYEVGYLSLDGRLDGKSIEELVVKNDIWFK